LACPAKDELAIFLETKYEDSAERTVPLRQRKEIQTVLRSATANVSAAIDPSKSECRNYSFLLPTLRGARSFAGCGGSDEESCPSVDAGYTSMDGLPVRLPQRIYTKAGNAPFTSSRACRILQGCGGAMMVPVGRLTLVRTFAKSDLLRTMSFVSIPALVAPMLGPIAGGLIVGYLHWRVIFFLNIPIGLTGLILVYLHLPDYREERPPPLDVVGLILFGSGIALLSYVLEIFGEHTLSAGAMSGLLVLSIALLAGYGIHGSSLPFPLLKLKLFSIRTFRAAVSGSFFTRLGLGGVPFLLPLLYQVGLGFTPIQSGLLVMPQAIASMSMKAMMPRILRRIGYRGVLISNTLILGVLLMVFATIGLRTPIWAIVLEAFLYGAFTSLQYTSMNTLVFADIAEKDASSASSIASTTQQMSISFGVAAAGLATAFFVPSTHSDPTEMIHGIHRALIALGVLTVLSTIVFRSLRSGDGDDVSLHKVLHPGG
jgi:MFS family permease